MENRFNNLSSKEWLPFQKSWFYHTNLEKTFIENLKFFTKASKNCPKRIFFYSSEKKNLKIVKDLCNDNFLELSEKINTNFDFALIDTLSLKKSKKTLEEEEKKILEISNRIFERINDRKFLCVLARNYIIKNNYITFAWDIAKNLSKIFSLKDEKT